MKRFLVAVVAVTALGISANAAVTYHQGTSEIGVQLGQATFDDLETFDPLQNYMEGGLTLDVDDFEFAFQPPGTPPEWVPPYYPNGGVNELITITRTDGMDFNVLEMNVAHGFAGTNIFGWAQAYLDGNLEGEFDFDVQAATLIGFTGQFDELRIGTYADAATRDAHNAANLNAGALDNVAFGNVPEPATLSLLGLGALALLRRR